MTITTKAKTHEPPCDLEPGDRWTQARRAPYEDRRHSAESPLKNRYTAMPLLGWIIPGAQRLSRYDCALPLPWPVTADGARDPLKPHYPWAVAFRNGWLWSAGAWYESLDTWLLDTDYVIETNGKIRGRSPGDDELESERGA